MDVQSSNGKGMLLKYDSSYVSTWHDAFCSGVMYTTRTGPYQAAYRYLCGLRPREPEMWMKLCPNKFAWSQSRTKRIMPNTQSQANLSSHDKYCERPVSEENLSFLQCLRLYNPKDKACNSGSTLLGVKFRIPFKDDYYYQDFLINFPHRN